MTERPSSRGNISTRLLRIAELSRQIRQAPLTTLAHFIDKEFLREAYQRTRKDGAVGIDRQTAAAYAEHLEENLESLLERFKSGSYKAPPCRRVYIPKGNGEQRPLGIPTFEDKVLQRAVAMVVEAVYETEFLECSYGFRPGRGAHQALDALDRQLHRHGGGWVLELDIRRFFDEMDHGHLRGFLDRRVRDGVLRRMIDKWLAAGVMEGGQWSRGKRGTPQGGVISPLLANIYLHEVLDRWFEEDVQPQMAGRARLFRYADDAVMVFSTERDARRVLAVLGDRVGRYGLRLHPEKTRLVPFYPPRGPRPGKGAGGTPEDRTSFDLLGMTFHWGKSRRGRWVVRRKTAKGRLARSIAGVWQWCKRFRHLKVQEQYAALVRMLRGHYAYFGVIGNYRCLDAFYTEVKRIWRFWLNRRSQRRRMPWSRFDSLLQHYRLPRPKIVHGRPRLAANP